MNITKAAKLMRFTVPEMIRICEKTPEIFGAHKECGEWIIEEMPFRECMEPEAVARVLRVPRSRIIYAARAGKIKAVKIGGVYRLDYQDAVLYMIINPPQFKQSNKGRMYGQKRSG